MAEVLTTRAALKADSKVVPGWWAVDRYIGGYLIVVGLLIAVYYRRVPGAPMWLVLHIAALAVMTIAMRMPDRFASFRHWYPLLYVSACYKEMSVLIPAIRGTDLDGWAAELDYHIWGAYPTVWLECLHRPWATEFLQIAYTLFVPCVLAVAGVLWIKRRYADFRYYAFLVALGFLASYVGYFFVPVRGPRFFIAHLQHIPLHGVFLFDWMQMTLDRLESAHYDCFPSGHTELTLIAWWGSRMISKRVFAVYSLYAVLIILATVYLRYHYTIDVFAGAITAAALLATAPGLYRAATGLPRTDKNS